MKVLMKDGIRVVPPAEAHREAWSVLYARYAEFYRKKQTPEMRERVWAWLQDPTHELEGAVALDGAGVPVGLAHYRAFVRPLAASEGCFLDDLYVVPAARGTGVAETLFGHLRSEARERGWTVIRWITAEDNYRARGMYDRVAARTDWVTYDLEP